MKIVIFVSIFLFSFSDRSVIYAKNPILKAKVERALIIGSAEQPDTILMKVKELEKKGILTDVIVLESFPVQIHVTGPKEITDMLKAMPRKKSPSFK